MLGTHTLKLWSVTQKHVTLSSAEAELMALVRCASECIGMTQMAQSWAIQVDAHIFADSSAALAICQRQGCGRLRHVRIGHLWIQERVRAQELVLRKIPGEVNPADMLTKGLTPGKFEPLMRKISQFSDRGEVAARVQLHMLIHQVAPLVLSASGMRPEEGCLTDLGKHQWRGCATAHFGSVYCDRCCHH